tara:strand:- start:5 stop:265 length:261 start_codon:yes stop_codon:yes gene_type:complete
MWWISDGRRGYSLRAVSAITNNNSSRSKSLSQTSSIRTNTSVNTKAMPLKHDQHQQFGMDYPKDPKEAPFPAMTTTPRRTKAGGLP